MERELFALRMEEYRTMVEDLLDAQCVAADEPYARLLDAMRYSLTAGGTAEQADAAQRYADALGLAFQIRDDMLDVIGDEATFGKPIGSDKAEKKTTFVDLLGLAACEREVVRLTDEAISALGLFGGEADFLAALSHSMETRNK